jgi:hypothetical protein
VEWLHALEACNMAQARRHLQTGAKPIFLLAPESSFMKPIWVMLIEKADGNVLRIVSNTDSTARRLTSVKQVYQVARTCGFYSLTIPVEHRK